MKKNSMLIVNSKILPSVFQKVVEVKELLADGKAKNVSEAVKSVGVSRSAFYKYKDYVFRLNNANNQTIKIEATLSDKAGVFSSMTKILSDNGANIITINQGAPNNGFAPVSLTVCTDNIVISTEELLAELKNANGIKTVKFI
ncbi:MAG: ACT domain-containing protein [Clostridia bacterium]|nr:ACT domain-containing protein [Clostridia bacterium]